MPTEPSALIISFSFSFSFLFLFFSSSAPPPQIWYQTNLSPPTKLFLNPSGTQFTTEAPPILQIPAVTCHYIVVSKLFSLQYSDCPPFSVLTHFFQAHF